MTHIMGISVGVYEWGTPVFIHKGPDVCRVYYMREGSPSFARAQRAAQHLAKQAWRQHRPASALARWGLS